MIALVSVIFEVSAELPDASADPDNRPDRDSGSAAETMRISVAEISGFGVFEAATTRRFSGYSTKTPAIDTVSGVRFLDRTTEVPGTLGTNFGFQYRLNTTPEGQKVAIKSVIRFPDGGLQHPSGQIYEQSVEHKYIKVGEIGLHGYGFDESWEIVPGQWRFEIWHGEVRLIRKTFTVVAEGIH